jgi:hypothetical protein
VSSSLKVDTREASATAPAIRWWQGWLPLVVLPTTIALLWPSTWPRWVFMWALAFAIYAGCKWLSWRRTTIRAPLGRHLGYLLAWPGMNAPEFLDASLVPQRPRWTELMFASTKLVIGIVVLFVFVRWMPEEYSYLTGWVGMVGIVLVLHFGVFHLLSWMWRRLGVVAPPLMGWPLASASIAEFWGRRWNRAFRDLTHRFLFRPLAKRLGPRRGLFAGFLVSGLIHDAIISLPAAGGYGGPTGFFLIQAVGIFADRSRIGRRLGLGSGWTGRAFTLLLLLGTAWLLFHPPFVERIVLPFFIALGAL